MGEISTKLQESSLNVMRTEEKYAMCKFVIDVPGKRRKGRPKRMWTVRIPSSMTRQKTKRDYHVKRRNTGLSCCRRLFSDTHKSGKRH